MPVTPVTPKRVSPLERQTRASSVYSRPSPTSMTTTTAGSRISFPSAASGATSAWATGPAPAPERPPGHHRGRPAGHLDMDGGKDEDLVMGAELALHGNAHRMRELAEVLLQKPSTMAELAAAIGVSVNDAEHILARLRKNGLPVAIVEDLDPEPRYRIVYPKGRVCAAEGCGTLLRRSNPSDRWRTARRRRPAASHGATSTGTCAQYAHGDTAVTFEGRLRRAGIPGGSRTTSPQPSPGRGAGGGPLHQPRAIRARHQASDGRRRRSSRGGARGSADLRGCELARGAPASRSLAV